MTELTNPFQILYVTEYIKSPEFPHLFSPVLVPQVTALFQPGNVVLHGTQGTGKSMLLSLLDSSVRLQFAQQKLPSPIPEQLRNFVGATVNLSSSNATKFNERSFSDDPDVDLGMCKAVFSDFLNYWVVRDLFRNLDRIISSGIDPERDLGVKVKASPNALDKSAKRLATDPCWFSALPEVGTRAHLEEQLGKRIRDYFAFLNFNSDHLPGHVASTKTTAGEPIKAAVKALRETEVICPDTSIFVIIDQFEELQRLESADDSRHKHRRFRDVIDKLLSARDETVSYRIGTRTSALPTSRPEELRDYIRINLDTQLIRTENSRNSLFRTFAEDVLRRRLAWASYKLPGTETPIRYVFGKSPTTKERAKKSAPANPRKVLRLDPDWPSSVREMLLKLAREDVLSAKLGEAWVRQKTTKIGSQTRSARAPSPIEDRPWEQPEARWWKKERTAQAILQIASLNNQRVVCYGEEDIVTLSGGSILVFGSICQHIWDAWIRNHRPSSAATPGVAPTNIETSLQEEGIRRASAIWRGKILETPGGHGRQRFIDHLGKMFHKGLVSDGQMSYPGANGFALSARDLAGSPPVEVQIYDTVAFGFLQQRPHTPKTHSRGESFKWYLQPILSPYYEVPFTHTKEPLYVTVDDVWNWLVDAQTIQGAKKRNRTRRRSDKRQQPSLFDSLGDEGEGKGDE
jgi:hypothetical protein